MSTITITIDTDMGTARISRTPSNANAQQALPPVALPRRDNQNKRKSINHRKPVEKPVAFVRNWLDTHPDLARKDAVAQLIELGINRSTVRTQYHKWAKSTVAE
jgi:hypothetical protein